MADLFKLNSLTRYYAYFTLTPLIISVIYYTATHNDDLRYVDALFMCFSAITGTGLDVLALSTQTSLQQGILFALIILGHAIPICGVLSLARAWSLRLDLQYTDTGNHNEKITIDADKEKLMATVKELPSCVSSPTESDAGQTDYGFITVVEPTHIEPTEVDRSNDAKKTNIIKDFKTCVHQRASIFLGTMRTGGKSLGLQRSIDYNQPGGLECLSVALVSVLVLIYFLGFLIIGIVGIGLWSHVFRPDIAHTDGVSAFWGGAFLATSALCNNGMSLITTNMGPFQKETFPLLAAGFLVLAGNTMFPCLLRLFIWTLKKISPGHPKWESWRRTLDFSLAQSQDVCNYLYPSWHTWFLFGTVIFLNSIMWAAFELSAIHNEEIGALPPKYRIIDGLFQALSVRGGGFSIVVFDRLPQGLLILYALMMYLSAFPVSATISNIEAFKKTCSITPIEHESDYSTEKDGRHLPKFTQVRLVCQQLRSQFNNDMWWLCFAVLIITIVESSRFKSNPLAFSTFNIIFEVISAYSCVGETIGFPGKSYAFSGEWHTFSKLLLIAVSLRGKIRSMPIASQGTGELQEESLGGFENKKPC